MTKPAIASRSPGADASIRFFDGACMGEIVNLKRFRKRVERAQAAQQAESNRTRFGRSKSERTRDEERNARDGQLLDQHRLDDGEAS